jgi:hypothetical protein
MESNQELTNHIETKAKPTREELRKKLLQKTKTQQLQRQSTDAQRTFLEKAKIPENMMDKALQVLKTKSNPQMLNMMTQMASLQQSIQPSSQMKSPTVDLK